MRVAYMYVYVFIERERERERNYTTRAEKKIYVGGTAARYALESWRYMHGD